MEDSFVIEIKDLNVKDNDNLILDNINMNILRNNITVLLGASGSGKTTLLKCLNRLTDLYSLDLEGKILLDGEDILNTDQDLTKIRQKMVLLSQKPYPLPMSIYKNITYGLKIQGIKDKAIIEEKVEKHLQEVALWDEVKDRLDDSPNKLSIGQQQRLCLARGLAVDPEIILADEPTSALDPISKEKIETLFLELKKTYTLVLVTHIVSQAQRLADYIFFMDEGKIIEFGDIKNMLNNPQTEMLKEYLKVGY